MEHFKHTVAFYVTLHNPILKRSLRRVRSPSLHTRQIETLYLDDRYSQRFERNRLNCTDKNESFVCFLVSRRIDTTK